MKINSERKKNLVDFLRQHKTLTEKAVSTPIEKFNTTIFIGGTPNDEARKLCNLAREEGLYSKSTVPMNKVNFLKTQNEYNHALARAYELIHADIDTDSPEAEELDRLTTAIEAYEAEHYPVEEEADPVEIIKFRMEQMNLKQKDVAPIFGGETRASEYLNKKRPLTMKIIYNLHKYLDIPYDLLVENREKYKLSPKAKEKLQRLMQA